MKAPDEIWIDPGEAFDEAVTWSTLPWGQYQARYILATTVEARIAEAERRGFEKGVKAAGEACEKERQGCVENDTKQAGLGALWCRRRIENLKYENHAND